MRRPWRHDGRHICPNVRRLPLSPIDVSIVRCDRPRKSCFVINATWNCLGEVNLTKFLGKFLFVRLRTFERQPFKGFQYGSIRPLKESESASRCSARQCIIKAVNCNVLVTKKLPQIMLAIEDPAKNPAATASATHRSQLGTRQRYRPHLQADIRP